MCFTTGSGSTLLAILLFLFATIQGVLGDQPSTHYTPSTGDIISFTVCGCVLVIVTLICCYFCPMCSIYKRRMKQSDGLIYSSSKSVPGYGTYPTTYPEGNTQLETEGYQQNSISVISINSV
ncbi:hypothetical protein R5R35_009319 [Gryllus longicercus]|uniref:Accessory gland protein n=1 Tax=Gryllus longicercus TaxID=2509291 RepID=A0AAN9ZFN0_9ORTH